MTSVYRFFSEGGIWMFPILIAQVVSIAIIIERSLALYGRRSVTAKSKVRMFEDDIKKGQMDKVVARTEKGGLDTINLMVRTGAQSVLNAAGKEEIQLKMDELIIEETSRIERRIGFLATIANVSTLLGLLGTIVGLIQSFAAISNSNGAERAKILSAAISEAMNATAYGLIVAVPALVMYAILQSRANSLSEDLNKAALRLYIWFGFGVESSVKSKRA
jgi:biopolymer transport protein ExbB